MVVGDPQLAVEVYKKGLVKVLLRPAQIQNGEAKRQCAFLQFQLSSLSQDKYK